MAAPSPNGRDRAAEWHALSGWGESVHTPARVLRPRSADEAAELLARLAARGGHVALRGAGRSYGDAALPTDRNVLDLRGMRAIGEFDAETGRVRAEPGVTIEQLWRTVVPHGWWPAVVPGTMRPTLGGCVAMNVHGKNQYRAGAIGEHVEDLELLTVDGERRTVHPDDELFRAVVGGAGLLGIVTSVSLRLKRVHSGLLDVTAMPVSSLREMLTLFEERKSGSDYLVGWLDAFDRRGRGVIHSASHVAAGDDPDPSASLAVSAQDLPDRLLGVLPLSRVALFLGPFGRPLGMRAINLAKYRAATLRGETRFRQAHAAFHFLLDYVPGWKSIYAPGGLIQHQTFVPIDTAADVLESHLARCRAADLLPWLSVVKRHRADDFLLTHNLDGISLALDFPVTPGNRESLWRLCQAMDEDTVRAGGRVYLAKDLTALPQTLATNTPGLARFREWKRELDPEGLLATAQSERLRIV